MGSGLEGGGEDIAGRWWCCDQESEEGLTTNGLGGDFSNAGKLWGKLRRGTLSREAMRIDDLY